MIKSLLLFGEVSDQEFIGVFFYTGMAYASDIEEGYIYQANRINQALLKIENALNDSFEFS